MRSAITTLLALGCLLTGTTSVHAQRRGELVESLLKGLIEAQRDRDRPPLPAPGTAPAPTDNGRPPQNRPAPAPGRPAQLPPELRTTRDEVQHMAEDGAALVQSLQIEVDGLPQLRPLLGDLMAVEAALEHLNRRLQAGRFPVDLNADYGVVNRDWRMVEYRLLQIADLSSRSRGLVKGMAAHDRRICELNGIEPQLDRTELVRLATELSTSYRQLMDNIYYDLRRDASQPLLLKEGQDLQLKLRQSLSNIDRARHDLLVAQFEDCLNSWRALSVKLHPRATERLRRDMLRIEQIGRAMQAQLWIDVTINPELVQQLVHSVEAEVQQVLRSVNLAELIRHPQPERLLASARDFQHGFEAFHQSAESNIPPDELIWDFRNLDVQWRTFAALCRTIESPAVQQQLASIDSLLSMLRQVLGIETGIDPAQLSQMIAQLDQLSFDLERTVKERILATRQYQPSVAAQISTALDGLHDALHELHEEAAHQAGAEHLVSHVGEVAVAWQQAKEVFALCRPEHQQLIAPLMTQIEPLMVKLQLLGLR